MRPFVPVLLTLSSLAFGQELSTVPQGSDWGTDWIDYDGDGLVDSLLLDARGPARLLRNMGDGEFQDVTRTAGLGEAEGVTRALWQDFDKDGHLDVLFVAPSGGTELYRADGVGAFQASGSEVGLDLAGRIDNAKWFDFDNDQQLDLLLMAPREHRLYRNEGAGDFRRVRIPLAPTELTVDHATSSRPDEQRAVPTPPASRGGVQASTSVNLGGGVATIASPGSSAMASLTCSAGVDDFSNPGTCIPGSTAPTLGMLYPISSDWFIDGLGSVGLGTTSPTARLDVDGLIRSRSGGIEFPDGTVQTTATLMGPAGTDALWQVDGNHMNHTGGRVGIGNDDPQERLHVSSGDLRVDRGTTTNSINRVFSLSGARDGNTTAFATINLRNYDSGDGQSDYHAAQIKSHNATQVDSGDLRISTNDGSGLNEAMRIDPDGKVGIGATNPAQALDVDGTIRSRNGGFEFPDGSLQATAVYSGVQYSSVGVGDFVARDSDTELKNSFLDGVYVNEVSGASIYAPLNLPNGARITGITGYVYDTVAADLEITLNRKRRDNTNAALLSTLDVLGSSGYFNSTQSLNHMIDNERGNYFLRVHPLNSGDWPGSSDLAIQSIVIQWTME